MQKKFTTKNWIGLILVILSLIGGFYNLKIRNEREKEQTEMLVEEKKEEVVEIPDPFVEVDSIEEAEKLAEFNIKITNIKELSQVIRVMPKEMIEVIYQNEAGEEAFRLRKALKTGFDISGDYNQYEQIEKLNIEDFEVETRGDKENIFVAVWSNNEYDFAFLSGNKKFSQQEVIDIIKNIE